MLATMQMENPSRTANMDLYDVTYYSLELEPGEMVTISLSYEGTPDFSFFRWDFFAFEDWIWTMSEP